MRSEKDGSINDEIERLRLSTTGSLLLRRDTVVVASVSCLYSLASPKDFLQMLLTLDFKRSYPARIRT